MVVVVESGMAGREVERHEMMGGVVAVVERGMARREVVWWLW